MGERRDGRKGRLYLVSRPRQEEWNESPKLNHLTIALHGGQPIRSQGRAEQSQGNLQKSRPFSGCEDRQTHRETQKQTW